MGFSTKKFGVTFNNITARGLANEDVTWEIADDEVTSYSDMRGTNGINVYNSQTAGTCTVTLQANSPTVALWSAAFKLQKQTGQDFPLMMYDRNEETKSIAFAPKAAVQKSPDFTRGSGEPTVQFVFTFPTCTPPLQG